MNAVDQLASALPKFGPFPDRARLFHDRIQAALEFLGWQTRREVDVQALRLGNGRCGRVDLVATREGASVAIELDRMSPRSRSLRKLSLMPVAERLVILRRRAPLHRVEGVAVFGLEVSP